MHGWVWGGQAWAGGPGGSLGRKEQRGQTAGSRLGCVQELDFALWK